jgi:hypothetical protein
MRKGVVSYVLLLTVVLFFDAAPQTPQGTISVAWNPVADQPGATVTGYQVCYTTSTTADPSTCDNLGLITSHTLGALQDCTAYRVGVKAKDSDGDVSESWSNIIQGWARPRITAVTPALVQVGRSITLTITGFNFSPDATVAFAGPWPGITIGQVTVQTCNQLQVIVQVASNAQLGQPEVRVVNGLIGGQGVYGAKAGAIQVVGAVKPAGVQGLRRGEV